MIAVIIYFLVVSIVFISYMTYSLCTIPKEKLAGEILVVSLTATAVSLGWIFTVPIFILTSISMALARLLRTDK